jgi:hypothetical protein
LQTDGSGNLEASTVTSTELGYVSGVTSGIQSQVDGKQASDATLTALAGYNTNGILTQTAADTFAGRTLTGTTNEVDVANGDGVSGNPTVGISDNPVLPGTGAVQVPAGTNAQRPTGVNGKFRYNSDSNKFEGYQNGAWGEIGGGAAGVNYITDTDAEGGVGSWATYADAAGTIPVDGTGGSPTITWTQNSTTPLRDAADFKFTKDAANRQGEGASYDFTVDRADLASVMRIEFDYDASDANYADDDVIVYIYDKDGTSLIEPVGIDLKAGKGTHVAYFQTDSANDDYRLILHQSSTNATAYSLYFDNIKVGPATRTYSTPTSDWKAYTPTTQGFGTISSDSFYWRRVGDSIEIQGHFTSGTATGDEAQIGLPNSLTIDSGKIASASYVGSWIRNITNATIIEYVCLATGGDSYINVGRRASSESPLTAVSGTGALGSSTEGTFLCKVPVVGWGSQVQMSDDADTRVVAFKGSTTSGQTWGNSGNIITFETVEHDTHGAFNTGTGVFTVPVSGKYHISACLLTASMTPTVGHALALQVEKNNVQKDYLNLIRQDATSGVYGVSGATTMSLVKGDTIELFAYSDTNTTTNTLADSCTFSIEKVQGPSAIAANELVALSARNSASTAVVNANLIPFATVDFDTHSAWDGTDTYTVPVSGKYQISGCIQTDTVAATAGQTLSSDINKNGTRFAIGSRDAADSATSRIYTSTWSVLVDAVKGDSITVAFNENIPAVNLLGTDDANYISIQRLGF